MGRSADHPWFRYSSPEHKVRITRPFYLGETEVTVEQYRRLVTPDYGGAMQLGPTYPVWYVRWDQAVEFCQRLSALPEEADAGRKYRLPTEAEWEYACRAGSTTCYSFGDTPSDLDAYAWSKRNADFSPHPVGEKLPNAWGLYDMYGNVAEFCSDWLGTKYYAHSPVDDPPGPETGPLRVARGGDFLNTESLCTSAARFGWPVHRGYAFVGFRVALSAMSKSEPPKEAK